MLSHRRRSPRHKKGVADYGTVVGPRFVIPMETSMECPTPNLEFRPLTDAEIESDPMHMHLLGAVLVFEVTSDGKGGILKDAPVEWSKKYKMRMVQPLDATIVHLVNEVLMFEMTGCSFYWFAYLRSFPHYLTYKGEPLNAICRRADSFAIKRTYHRADMDVYDVEGRFVFLHNVHLHPKYGREICELDFATIASETVEVGSQSEEGRGSRSSSIGISGTRARGWNSPRPDLHEYADNGKLRREGVTTSMPQRLREALAPSMNLQGRMMMETWPENKVKKPFWDVLRQQECSERLGESMSAKVPVLFEGANANGITTQEEGCFVHVDNPNDNRPGYEGTGSLATIIYDKERKSSMRLAQICYTRRRCGNWMDRLSECSSRKRLWEEASLAKRYNRSLLRRVVEWAAIRWTGAVDPGNGEGLFVNLFASNIVQTVERMGMKPSHEERPQLEAFTKKILELFPTTKELLSQLPAIMRCLTMTVSSHSKTNKLDAALALSSFDTPDKLVRQFSNWRRALRWKLSRSSETGGWVDVYGEYSLARMRKKESFCRQQDAALKEWTKCIGPLMGVDEFLKSLKDMKIFLLGGNLFHPHTLVVCKQLGLVRRDQSYDSYLPNVFTKHSGSRKLVFKALGMENHYVARRYLLNFASEIGVPAMTVENVFCKFWVGFFMAQPANARYLEPGWDGEEGWFASTNPE